MRLFTCWIEHSSLSGAAQIAMLGIAGGVFKHLDYSAWRVKQMFAAEVLRLEAESPDQCVKLAASRLLYQFPEIQELWLQSSPYKFRTSGGPHSSR